MVHGYPLQAKAFFVLPEVSESQESSVPAGRKRLEKVGVLQSALWLERERANAAVKASRSAIGAASKTKTNAGARTAMITMNPNSPASVAAAEAAATAAGTLATSSTGGRGGGLSLQRRHGFPAKQAAGGAAGARAAHGGPSRRPSTASAATIVPCARTSRTRAPTGGEARGLYGEGSSEFWGGGSGDNGVGGGGGGGGNTGGLAGCFGANGNLTDPFLAGLDGWDAQQQGHERIGHFELDLDGRRGYACSGGGGLGDGGLGGGETVTPFQRWKNDRGITSPGVAEMFAGHGCGPLANER